MSAIGKQDLVMEFGGNLLKAEDGSMCSLALDDEELILSAITNETRLYKVFGRKSLIGGDWVYPTNSLHRFFKISVEMQ